MTSPLRSVLAAFDAGARSRAELAERSGLSADLVDAAVEHLVRVGRISADPLATSCSGGSCSSCAAADEQLGAHSCTADSSRGGRPVLVQLSVRRSDSH
ncbi:MAG: hypothetical protein ABS81_11480 [Pseudonocardia sp. SCN 72-86]|nr:MAG: hypothetical protein ABS81_11480 [Pseudonocardia sp. SCN 72-86]